MIGKTPHISSSGHMHMYTHTYVHPYMHIHTHKHMYTHKLAQAVILVLQCVFYGSVAQIFNGKDGPDWWFPDF